MGGGRRQLARQHEDGVDDEQHPAARHHTGGGEPVVLADDGGEDAAPRPVEIAPHRSAAPLTTSAASSPAVRAAVQPAPIAVSACTRSSTTTTPHTAKAVRRHSRPSHASPSTRPRSATTSADWVSSSETHCRDADAEWATAAGSPCPDANSSRFARNAATARRCPSRAPCGQSPQVQPPPRARPDRRRAPALTRPRPVSPPAPPRPLPPSPRQELPCGQTFRTPDCRTTALQLRRDDSELCRTEHGPRPAGLVSAGEARTPVLTRLREFAYGRDHPARRDLGLRRQHGQDHAGTAPLRAAVPADVRRDRRAPGGDRGHRLRTRTQARPPAAEAARGRRPASPGDRRPAARRRRTRTGWRWTSTVPGSPSTSPRRSAARCSSTRSPRNRRRPTSCPGPPVPVSVRSSDGTVSFDGTQVRIDWADTSDRVKRATGPRIIAVSGPRAGRVAAQLRLRGRLSALRDRRDRLLQTAAREGPVRPRPVGQHPPRPADGARRHRRHRPPAASVHPARASTSDRPQPDRAGRRTACPADHHDVLLRRLRELGELHRDGVLTDEEFATTKAAVLRGF